MLHRTGDLVEILPGFDSETGAAAEHLAAIRANVENYYADRIDVRAFHARQRAMWAEIVAAGLLDAVSALQRAGR